MRYAIFDTEGNIVNTFVCDDPEYAASIGGVEYPYPDEPVPETDEEVTTAELAAAILEGVVEV